MHPMNKARQGTMVSLDHINGYEDDYGLEEGEIYFVESVEFDNAGNVRRLYIDALDKSVEACDFMVVSTQAGDSFWGKMQSLSTQRS